MSLQTSVGHHMATGSVKRGENGTFAKGSNGGHHGAPGRSGRPPSAFTQAAREIFDKYRLLEVAARIAAGDIEETFLDDDGAVHSSPTKNSDRLAALKWIASYAHGQPTQRIEHTGEEGGPIEYLEHAKTDFESRVARITARLGSAAMPEGIE